MKSQMIAKRSTIVPVILLQFIPFFLFPPASFSLTTQEWWLPVVLGAMVVIADVQIIFERGNSSWPWNLMSFAQGFNIISRLMLIWSHATITGNGITTLNLPYIGLTATAVFLSAIVLWYVELPEVRIAMAK